MNERVLLTLEGAPHRGSGAVLRALLLAPTHGMTVAALAHVPGGGGGSGGDSEGACRALRACLDRTEALRRAPPGDRVVLLGQGWLRRVPQGLRGLRAETERALLAGVPPGLLPTRHVAVHLLTDPHECFDQLASSSPSAAAASSLASTAEADHGPGHGHLHGAPGWWCLADVEAAQREVCEAAAEGAGLPGVPLEVHRVRCPPFFDDNEADLAAVADQVRALLAPQNGRKNFPHAPGNERCTELPEPWPTTPA